LSLENIQLSRKDYLLHIYIYLTHAVKEEKKEQLKKKYLVPVE